MVLLIISGQSVCSLLLRKARIMGIFCTALEAGGHLVMYSQTCPRREHERQSRPQLNKHDSLSQINLCDCFNHKTEHKST